MKIVDTSGSLMWRMRQSNSSARATGQYMGDQTLRNKLRELHRISTTTIHPSAGGFYAEGRSNLEYYRQGFVKIEAFNEAYTSSVQNARLTDEEIDELLERMNLTAR
jgi:hypothetical protein